MKKLFFLLLTLSGCGYTLQGSHSPLLDTEQIHRVYVKPVLNDTFKAGVEHYVYNALIKTLAAGRRVKLVRSAELADAVLEGRVTDASTVVSSLNAMSDLNPKGVPTDSSIQVASVYRASLQCSFTLIRTVVPPGKKANVWTGAFSRAKTYPSATQLDVPGTTSALINESEFDRALGDLSGSMMGDVHESMLAMF